jgi:hypothetical protein
MDTKRKPENNDIEQSPYKKTKTNNQSNITSRQELWEKCDYIIKDSTYYKRICRFFDTEPGDFVMTEECIDSLLSEIPDDDLFFFFSSLKNRNTDHSADELMRFLTIAVKIKDLYHEQFDVATDVLNIFYCKYSLHHKTNLNCLKLALHYLTPSGVFDNVAVYNKAYMSSCITFANWVYNAITPSTDVRDITAIINWITFDLCLNICDGCEVPDRDIQYMRATLFYHVTMAVQNKWRVDWLLDYKNIASFLKTKLTSEEQADWDDVLGVSNRDLTRRRIAFVDTKFVMQSFSLLNIHPIFGSFLEFNKCVVYGETVALPMYEVQYISKNKKIFSSDVAYCHNTQKTMTPSGGIMIACVMGKFLRILKEAIKRGWMVSNKTPIDYGLVNPEIFITVKISDPTEQYRDVILVVVRTENITTFVNNIDSCLFQVVYDGEKIHCTPNHALSVFSGVNCVVLTNTPSPFIMQHANHGFLDMWKWLLKYRDNFSSIIPHNKARTEESHLTRTLDFTGYITTQLNTQHNDRITLPVNNMASEDNDDVLNVIDALILKHDQTV